MTNSINYIQHIGSREDLYRPLFDECEFKSGDIINRTYHQECAYGKCTRESTCPLCLGTGLVKQVSPWEFHFEGLDDLMVGNKSTKLLSYHYPYHIQDKITVPIYEKTVLIRDDTYNLIFNISKVNWKTRLVTFELVSIEKVRL